jgi:hypothetical protein
VNAQMSKNRINPPAPMSFDRTKLAIVMGVRSHFGVIIQFS